jgi:hypothetical protein
MNLQDPIAAYTAKGNMDAKMAQQFLESRGIEAFAVEDHSIVGHFAFGSLPEIHKPQVWINGCDAEQAGLALAEFEQLRIDRDAERKANEPQTIEAHCEDCGKSSTFAGSLDGTVQNCPHCSSFVDVGEFEWEEESDEEGEDTN